MNPDVDMDKLRTYKLIKERNIWIEILPNKNSDLYNSFFIGH